MSYYFFDDFFNSKSTVANDLNKEKSYPLWRDEVKLKCENLSLKTNELSRRDHNSSRGLSLDDFKERGYFPKLRY